MKSYKEFDYVQMRKWETALEEENLVEVRKFLDQGMNPNAFIGTNNRINNMSGYPLTFACETGRINLVKELLKQPDIKIEIEDKGGMDGSKTPLMFACVENEPEIVKLLIQAGARVETKFKSGLDALFYACVADASECVRLLLLYGASPLNKYTWQDAKWNRHEDEGIIEVCKHFESPKCLIILQHWFSKEDEI